MFSISGRSPEAFVHLWRASRAPNLFVVTLRIRGDVVVCVDFVRTRQLGHHWHRGRCRESEAPCRRGGLCDEPQSSGRRGVGDRRDRSLPHRPVAARHVHPHLRTRGLQSHHSLRAHLESRAHHSSEHVDAARGHRGRSADHRRTRARRRHQLDDPGSQRGPEVSQERLVHSSLGQRNAFIRVDCPGGAPSCSRCVRVRLLGSDLG